MGGIEQLDVWRSHNPITVYRRTKGVSQTDVATLLGVSTISMNAWENGRTTPSDVSMQALADLMKIGINTLSRAWKKWVAEKPGGLG